MEKIYIIVGLGNPGKEYSLTRHNVGFNVIDFLADKYSIDVDKFKFKALMGVGKIGEKKVVLVKPQTYMNSSGESVLEIMSWYRVPLENILVIYDDIDIELGKLKIRAKGSAGGHNGLKSVINLLNSKEFPRIRIGIGKPPEKYELMNYVLGKFSEEEREKVNVSVNKAVDAIECFLKDSIDNAMNKFNI